MKLISRVLTDIFLIKDTCSVYLLREGNKALAIDFGTGRALECLAELGIDELAWVLHTHHHREQCQGDAKLKDLPTNIAVPAEEFRLFSEPESHWQRVDRVPPAGAHFARPLRQGIEVARTLQPFEDFCWGKYCLTALPTPGNSPGALSFLLHHPEAVVVFCGDAILDGGKLHNYYDSEWDYGYGGGLIALTNSLETIRSYHPDILLPSHGEVILDPANQLDSLHDRLDRFIYNLLLRDRDAQDEAQAYQVSETTMIPGIRQISPHVFVAREQGRPADNMYIILADSGRALLMDVGIFRPDGEKWLDHCIMGMRRFYGLKGIDAVLVSHYHGDHLLQLPYAVETYGAQVWCYEGFADVIEHPRRYNLAWLRTAYECQQREIKVDRLLGDGENVSWEGFRFQVVHLPGQTFYGMGLAGPIDDRMVVFSGDNVFYNRCLSGHDAFVARNKGILETGYSQCAAVLRALNPDLLLGGHGQEIENPLRQVEQLARWASCFRASLAELSPDSSYEYFIDPYWVEPYPYQNRVKAGNGCDVEINIRNHRGRPKHIALTFFAEEQWSVVPRQVSKVLPPRGRFRERIRVEVPKDTTPGWYPITVDVCSDGEQLGELFHFLVAVDVPGLVGW